MHEPLEESMVDMDLDNAETLLDIVLEQAVRNQCDCEHDDPKNISSIERRTHRTSMDWPGGIDARSEH